MKTFIRFTLIVQAKADDFIDAGDVYIAPEDVQVIAPSLTSDGKFDVRPGFAHIHMKQGPPICVKGGSAEVHGKLTDKTGWTSKTGGEIKVLPSTYTIMTKIIKPLRDRVLLEFRAGLESEHNSDIVIPDSVYVRRAKAVVLAKGPECDDRVALGDIVLVPPMGGIEVDDGTHKKLKLYKQETLIARF